MKRRKSVDSFDNPIVRILILFITLALLAITWSQRRELARMSELGYVGIFLINFISSATVLVPIPGIASVFVGGAIWNPVLVGLISGIGASLGELLSYLVGFGTRGILKDLEKHKWIKYVEKYFRRAGFITILTASVIPLPIFDFIGILAGVLNYSVWKFALATFIGRIIRNILIAVSGAQFLP